MHLTRFYFLAAGLLSSPELVSAGTVRRSRRSVECYFATPAASGDTCERLTSGWGIAVDLFIDTNPGVTCPKFQAGPPYCVIVDWTPDEGSTSTSSQTENPTTNTSTTIQSSTVQSITTSSYQSLTTTDSVIPSIYPTMPGIDENCDAFHVVKPGDQCDTIASEHGITVAQLKSWNAEINSACSNLWIDYYVCTHVPGAVLQSITTSAPTPSNTPTMPGIAPTCDRFYKVKSGDQCDTIASRNQILVT